METETTIFGAVAAELAGAFEIATRTGGGEFYRLRSDAPAWIVDGELPHGFHVAVDGDDPRLPCDYLYRLAALAAYFIAEHDNADAARDDVPEWAAARADYSIPRLFQWAADHANNRALADESAESMGLGVSGGFEEAAVAALQGGQILAAERVAEYLISAVSEEAATRGE